MSQSFVSLDDIQAVARKIQPHIQATPLHRASSALASNQVFLKREDLQITNSFTARAALGIFLGLSLEHRRRGLVLTTPGNLGWGFLYALEKFATTDLAPTRLTIVIPEDAVEAKLVELKSYTRPGFQIVQRGLSETDRYSIVEEIAQRDGLLPLSLHDRQSEVAAKGTIALEIIDELKALVPQSTPLTFVCPVGSGALLAGCGVALKSLLGNKVHIVGAEPKVANDFSRLFRERKKLSFTGSTQMNPQSTIADSLRSPMVRQEYVDTLLNCVDQVIEVEDSEIVESMRTLFEQEGIAAEPSAAITVAALKQIESPLTVCLITSGNVDRRRFSFFAKSPQY